MFSELFVLLLLLSIFGLVVGLIKPSLVKKESRKSVLSYFSKGTVLCFLLLCISVPPVPIENQQSIVPATNQQSQVVAQSAPVAYVTSTDSTDSTRGVENSAVPQVKGENTEKSVTQETQPIVQAAPPITSTVKNVATTNTRQNVNGVVKMSNTHICHAPGTTYYSRTIHYTSYDSLAECLAAGGRLPKR